MFGYKHRSNNNFFKMYPKSPNIFILGDNFSLYWNLKHWNWEFIDYWFCSMGKSEQFQTWQRTITKQPSLSATLFLPSEGGNICLMKSFCEYSCKWERQKGLSVSLFNDIVRILFLDESYTGMNWNKHIFWVLLQKILEILMLLNSFYPWRYCNLCCHWRQYCFRDDLF